MSLLKLEQIGTRGNALGWIKCSLTKPSQKVVFESISSEEVSFHKEYHRGQSLLLSLLFVDVIETNIDSQMHLFADDCLLHRVIKHDSDCLKL